jgi:hypothetical protein
MKEPTAIADARLAMGFWRYVIFALVIGPLLVCVDVATTGAKRIYDSFVSGLFRDLGDLYQSVLIDMGRTSLTYRVPIQWHAILGKL